MPDLPPFPKRIPEKLRTIREHFNLSPDEIAPKVGARTGAEILAYENDEDDLLITVLWNYSRLAGCPIDNLIYDHLEVRVRDLSLV
jgi:hypothetical protein